MKNIIVLLSLMLLVACNNETTSENPEVITTSEASWACEFVKVDNQSYQLTNEENFDSNSLTPGTKLYKNPEDKKSIIYEINEKYLKATVY